MVATTTRRRCGDHDSDQIHARKRQCSRGVMALTCNAAWQGGDAAAEFLRQFNLPGTGMASSPEQPVNQLAWRCFAEFNVRNVCNTVLVALVCK